MPLCTLGEVHVKICKVGMWKQFTSSLLKQLPNFGEYLLEKEKLAGDMLETVNLLDEKYRPAPTRPVLPPKIPVPKVEDMIGRALPMIGSYGELDNKQQVVAEIDLVSAFEGTFSCFSN